MKYNIALIKGDGIGPEIVNEAVKVLDKACEVFGHEMTYAELAAGGNAIDAYGQPLPPETLKICKESDSVLLGAVGGPKWDSLPGDMRPERALLGLREGLDLYANIRPIILHKSLAEACPLKSEIIRDGLDIVIVRELTGGIYFGERGRYTDEKGEDKAFDTECYSAGEVEGS